MRRRWLYKHHAAGDDTGSLPMAMLLTMVGLMLSGIMVPEVLAQVQTTTMDDSGIHALSAAQAGLDVVVGHIRAAADSTGAGLPAALPCEPASSSAATERPVFTGTVADASTEGYAVYLSYLAVDPQGQNNDWAYTHRLSCSAGTGPVNTPAFGYIRAVGSYTMSGGGSPTRTRTLRATYTFDVTNQNIDGGLIHVYRTADAVNDLCLDAGSASPGAGTMVQMQVCHEGSDQQSFAYAKNLDIILTQSVNAANPQGMCLDAGPVPHAAGRLVALQPCASPTTEPAQQWSMNDSSNLEGTSNGSDLDGFCFNVQSPDVPGSFVVLGTGATCHHGYDNVETFTPEAEVGAGAAGIMRPLSGVVLCPPDQDQCVPCPPTEPACKGQLVNYKQFGRCLDVTEFNLNYGYLISWPCKQAPNPYNVGWNQRWALPNAVNGPTGVRGTVSTANPGDNVPYCLRSPGSTDPGQYVTPVNCAAGPENDTTWTVFGDTGSYSTSYRIEDLDGDCLAPTDPTDTPFDHYPKGLGVSKIVVAPCDGSALQKWNAPANVEPPSPLTDISEQ